MNFEFAGLWSKQVDAKASSLNTNDAYLLKLPQGDGYIWKGKGATEEEERGAKYMSENLKCKTKAVTEGNEPGIYNRFNSHSSYSLLAH